MERKSYWVNSYNVVIDSCNLYPPKKSVSTRFWASVKLKSMKRERRKWTKSHLIQICRSRGFQLNVNNTIRNLWIIIMLEQFDVIWWLRNTKSTCFIYNQGSLIVYSNFCLRRPCRNRKEHQVHFEIVRKV